MGKSSIEQQCEKIFRHLNEGSYGTRARYENSCKVLTDFLGDTCKLQNLRNLQDKHLAAFIEFRQSKGISPKTIQNDLAAIRKMHDQLNDPRHNISTNQELEKNFNIKIGKVVTLKGDRAWTLEEYQNGQRWAESRGMEKFKEAMTIAREMGLRVSEIVCMRRHQAVEALRSGVYRVGKEAKNGREREVPVSEKAKESLQLLVQKTKPGERIFIQPGKKAKTVRNQFEKLMEKMRKEIVTGEGQKNRGNNQLTWHGLRYLYAQNRLNELYNQFLQRGLHPRDSMDAAKNKLTRELGHNRIDVLKVYLQGPAPGEDPDPKD